MKTIEKRTDKTSKEIKISATVSPKLHDARKDALNISKELDKKIDGIRSRFNDMINISIEKAAAHFEDPSAYPLSADNRTIERAFYNLLEALPRIRRNKVIDKINETLKAGIENRTASYGNLANVNFKSAVPISEQVKSFLIPAEMKITEEESHKLLDKVKERHIKKSLPRPQQVGAAASKLSLVLNSITCLKTDDVKKDELSVAGFILDPLANKIDIVQFDAGKFKEGDVVPFNRSLAEVTIISNFPESYSASLFLVERDLISNPEITDKIKILMAAIGYTLTGLSVVICIAAPVLSWVIFGIGVFSMFARYFLPLLNDDISLVSEDVLTLAEKVDVGDTFERNVNISGPNTIAQFDGIYSLSFKWEGIA